MNPEETLKDLGLGEKEAHIYLALLELGESAVSLIAKRSGIKRPTAYIILNSLEEKGFVSRAMRGKKMFFLPQHPQKLKTEAEIRLRELGDVLPQLEALFHKKEGKPRVVMFEGKDRLDHAFDEFFVVRGEVVVMGTLKLSQEAFPRTFKKADYVTFSPEFHLRELTDKSEEGRAYAQRVRKPYREIRFLKEEMLPFEADISVFGNKTLITSVKKEFFTISIESEEISNAFRKIFEVMWVASKE